MVASEPDYFGVLEEFHGIWGVKRMEIWKWEGDLGNETVGDGSLVLDPTLLRLAEFRTRQRALDAHFTLQLSVPVQRWDLTVIPYAFMSFWW